MNILSEEELNEVVDIVCMTALDMPVHPGDQGELQAAEHLTASIAISGAWNGVVKVCASLALLRRAASVIFSINIDDVESSDCVDTITELTNMLGGTVKCMLPESCNRALPQIVSSDEAGCEEHEWAYFNCDVLPLAVAVIDGGSAVRAA